MHLAVTDLGVRFAKVEALTHVTADFAVGTHAVLWGPAGSGKTTLLKALAGLVRATTGEVTWDGKDVATLSVEARREAQAAFGMVFQTDALFDSMSVLDNVLLPLRKRGVAEAVAQAQALEALDRVGLAQAAQKSPQHLSGGMKKRCGVARAIVAKPRVLLADDPFAGLDPATEASIAGLLLEVSAGCTLIAALPDPVAALPADRWLRLEGGRVVRDGPPWEVAA